MCAIQWLQRWTRYLEKEWAFGRAGTSQAREEKTNDTVEVEK